MLCVSIATSSHHRLIESHAKLVADGVKFVELRLDFLRKNPELSRIIPVRPSAAIATCRRRQDGGQWRETEEMRLTTLRAAIAAGIEYVDLEEDVAASIPRYGKTRRVISHHDMHGFPDDLEALYQRMMKCDPDFVKIAVMPKTVDQLFDFLQFVREKNRQAKAGTAGFARTIGIGMGELGQLSRILAKRFEMPYTYATFSHSRIIAPGMLDYKELSDDYRYDKLPADANVYGVVGFPVGHSLSPAIHNGSFVAAGINSVYLPFAIPPEELHRFVERAGEIGVKGLSITIPHKVSVIEKLTQEDKAVEAIGACNTVVFKDDGQIIGYNTDYVAAVLSIEIAAGGKGHETPSVLQDKTALVLGSGGAGKAIAYGLKKRGVDVTVTDGNFARAKELSAQLGCECCGWNERAEHKIDILVNCTPLGMFPNVDGTPAEDSMFHAGMVVFDSVYNPERTMFLSQAETRGCKTVSGVEMFVGQACLQFKLFTGEKASAKLMRDIVKQAISAIK
ncbi:MAG: shikimate dehydrogenase [Planctomycetaceae bacterium]|jgi:3-dehydroquinate dehydratase/shikimate dehydrogenase|nr:shikimate dehydrogenase [Planctomycetaceae bacterium]